MNIVVKQSTLPILYKTLGKNCTNTSRFPVNRIYCIGRNYKDHAIEMGHDPDREPPFFFQKPADAIVDTAASKETCVIPYPPMTESVHHEAELVVAIGKGGLRIQKEHALDHVFGYAIGADLTRRDLQSEAKKLGRPWAVAKGFDYSAPCGPIVAVSPLSSLSPSSPKEAAEPECTRLGVDIGADTAISLLVNGEKRQDSTVGKMIWSIPEIISILSEYFRLKPGDLIFTGTPKGVSALERGDHVTIHCGDLPSCDFIVGDDEIS